MYTLFIPIKVIPYIVIGGLTYSIFNDFYKRYWTNNISNITIDDKLPLTPFILINPGGVTGFLYGYLKYKIITFE
jgi:hypothetical protein